MEHQYDLGVAFAKVQEQISKDAQAAKSKVSTWKTDNAMVDRVSALVEMDMTLDILTYLYSKGSYNATFAEIFGYVKQCQWGGFISISNGTKFYKDFNS